MRTRYTDYMVFELTTPKREWLLKMAEFYDMGWHFDVDNPDHIELLKYRTRNTVSNHWYILDCMVDVVSPDLLAEAYDDWKLSITTIKKCE